jgi:hypothetical protein
VTDLSYYRAAELLNQNNNGDNNGRAVVVLLTGPNVLLADK